MSRVVYEVTLSVERDSAAAFLAWLHAHVREMLALPGFVDARVFEVVEPAAEGPAEGGPVVYCCHYRLHDAGALDDYLARDASRMRADGQARFGGRFSAQRRVLRVLAGD